MTPIKTSDPPTELEASPAWAVLCNSSRRMYLAIVAEAASVGGDAAVISREAFEARGITKSALAPGSRELLALGLVTIENIKGNGKRYRLSDGWRDAPMTLKEARLASAQAREPRPARPISHRVEAKRKPLDETARAALRDARGRVDRQPARSRLGSSCYAEPKPISLAPLAWPTNPNWRDLVK